MWSRSVVKQALRAVRIHRTTSAAVLPNVLSSPQQNNRLYATEPTEDFDLLFDLGRERPKTTKSIKAKFESRHSSSGNDKANILEAINFNPKSDARQSKEANRALSRNRSSFNEPDESEKAVQSSKEAKAARKKLIADAPTFEELSVHDAGLNLSYVKLPLNHPKIQSLMLLTRSRQFRAQKHLLMLEGNRLIEDALNAGVPLKYLFFSKHDKLKPIKDLLHDKCASEMPQIFRVPQHDLTFWSVMTSCPGLIAIFEKPNDMTAVWEKAGAQNRESPAGEPRVTVVCDQIREPSNIGSVIRTCAALPCEQVLLMKGCTDPWEPKALRGGCGAQFRIPVLGPMDWSSLPSFLPTANGYSVFVASTKSEETINGTNRTFKSTPYSSVPFSHCNHVVLIIGGETEGISDDALRFMSIKTGQNSVTGGRPEPPYNSCIHIPLSNGVESLNSNAAAAIMLFEIRKQLQEI